MNLAHILKLAGKFVVRGFVFKAGKKLALKGGRAGIGAGALIAGGYLAYQLLQEREKQQEEKRKKKSKKNTGRKN
ncbi:hypothetical protein NE848_08160 [Gramella jeungdoensis]|uniref:DUF2892 domain-containing protein n=1 Tax=Gramella jeungdoensis TaxID=708091 RepID=A0ABT0Z1C2_9FLAO|nr:hypothetical protein [Gramella jeungdoensis]MCM8569349.1 hypothetical protein [Gramella jeungdoensis]